MGGCARVALVSLTLSAGFGLAGCAAIDDLKVSIFRWLDPVNFTGEGEELLGYAPEIRLIPPAEIPKQAAKAPSKRIKPATVNCSGRRPLCFLQRTHRYPDSPETATPGETEGQSAWPHSMRSRIPNPEAPSHPSLTRGFAPSAGACPQKLSKCTYFPPEREESRVGEESLPLALRETLHSLLPLMRGQSTGTTNLTPSFRAPSYATATLAPSKGRLMRCTVDGLTPNRSAMTRMPGRPGVARASRIRFSSAGAIGGRPRRFPSLLALASPGQPPRAAS